MKMISIEARQEDYTALHNINVAIQRYTNIRYELYNQQTRIYF